MYKFPLPLSPGSIKLKQSWAQLDVVHSVLVSQLKNPEFRKPQSLKRGHWQTCPHFSRRETSFFKLVFKQTCLQPWRGTLFLSSKAVCCRNIPSLVQDKSWYMCRSVMENLSSSNDMWPLLKHTIYHFILTVGFQN